MERSRFGETFGKGTVGVPFPSDRPVGISGLGGISSQDGGSCLSRTLSVDKSRPMSVFSVLRVLKRGKFGLRNLYRTVNKVPVPSYPKDNYF